MRFATQTIRHGIRHASLILALLLPIASAHAGDAELEKLKQALQSPQEATRIDAIRKLKVTGAEASKAAEALVPLLTDNSEAVRKAAVAALRKIGPAAVPAVSKRLEDKDSRALAIQILESLSGDRSAAVEPLAQVARAGEPLAATALGKIGPSARSALMTLLDNKDAEVRVAALDALNQIGPADKSALPALHKLVKDPQPAARFATVRLLTRSVSAVPEANELLMLALADEDWQTRRAASSALGKAGPIVTARLIEVVENNKNPLARSEAIQALGSLGQNAKAAIKPLVEVLRDPNHRHLHVQALAALANMNPEAGTALVGMLQDRDSNVRVTALQALTTEQARGTKGLLVKMLSDPAVEVRWASATALQRAGPDVFQDVEPLLTVPKDEVRAAAVQAAGPFLPLATLGKLLRDDALVVNRTSAALLAQRGSDAFPALTEALRSKNFRTERAATIAIESMKDRADDLIPALVDVLLTRETQAPEAIAQTILRVNAMYGARRLAARTTLPVLLRLVKKAGLLEKEHPEVQELVCLALAERGSVAKEALPMLTELLKNPQTDVSVLVAAARAVDSIEAKDAAIQLAPDLLTRIVQGTHKRSRQLRDEGMTDLVRVGLKGDTFEAIVTMLSLDSGTEDANEWIIHHANASQSWNLAGPNLVRVLALFHARSKHRRGQLSPPAEKALKAHLWRYLHQPLPGKPLGLQPRPLTEVTAVLPIDQLSWTVSAYLALDVLKDDPEYRERKIQGRALAEYFQEWTIWWREWARERAVRGLWSEMGLSVHQSFIWPNLLNMVDLASDTVVRQRFRMLLDLTMIEEEQISIQGTRAGRRGKKVDDGAADRRVGSDLDPWKDLLFGENPRRFADANINYRSIYWTTSYTLPPAAILLHKLPRPIPHATIANHHFHGGTVFGYRAPHYVLGCQFSQPKSTSEFPGSWHRLVFDDASAVLMQAARHQVQHKNVHVCRVGKAEEPVIEFTAALKSVEREGWIFVSNGPAFAGIHITGGYQLVRSGRKSLGRQTCDAVFAKTPNAMILLHAGDEQSFGSFEKFQDALCSARLTITEASLHYTGPNLPAIEFFRDASKASLIAGQPQLQRSETKQYDGPYLQGEVGQPRITVSVGTYRAVYDFQNNTVTER